MTQSIDDTTAAKAQAVHQRAECLFNAEAVSVAFDRLAAAITTELRNARPLVLGVLNGGVFPTVQLLERFDFLLELEFVHATRYRGNLCGGELEWRVRPQSSLRGRTVLVIDDIFDEGYTLAAVSDFCRDAGAERVVTAVLADKEHNRKVPDFDVDFRGLTVPDRYVYGVGMDYHGFFRNLPAIYAVDPGDL